MTYSVWLVPAYSDAKYYNQIIASLSKQYAAPKFAAHMTIYSKISSISEAKKAVSAIKSKKIRAKILGIGKSDYLWKTLFVKIKIRMKYLFTILFNFMVFFDFLQK